MNPVDHRFWREQLGAYVLGQLSKAEADAVRSHLEGCPSCRAEHEELAPLATALRHADPAHVATAAAPPSELWGRIQAQIAEERRELKRRRRTRRLVGALAALLAIATVVIGVTVLPTTPKAPPLENIRVTAGEPGIDASADLIAHTWGTEIILVASGLEEGDTFTVVFQDDQGRNIPAGTFIGTGDEPVTCRLNAALLRDEARGIRVLTPAGETVLRANLS